MALDIFEKCSEINDLLIENKNLNARDELIKLLDYHQTKNIQYTPLINNLIRQTGLYPYIDYENANWQEKFLYELFKVDTGDDEELTLHREQSRLLKKLLNNESIAVSAPTSFGKSFVIDAYISIKKPDTVVIIVPTIALTDETRRRLYKKFSDTYKIITTAEAELADKNILVFPQERAINYVNKLESVDILIIDEFYKASSKFDKDRSSTLVKAILKLGKVAKQKYFLAPNIKKLNNNPFTKDMEFVELDFNTVFLEKHNLYETIKKDEEAKSNELVKILSNKQTKTLIYAGTYKNIESISNLLLTSLPDKDRSLLLDFSKWLGKNYSYNWSLTKLVKKGTGVHNGKLHRSISQIQVKLFSEKNDGIDDLISTSSIIEGVNTSAENVVIWANRSGKGNAKLNDFTYKNIIGRGGRMFKHFIGKIYILDEPPRESQAQLDIPFPEEILGDLDEEKFKDDLTTEQIAKIISYKEEMKDILGEMKFEEIMSKNSFQTSNMDLIKDIALDMKKNPSNWNGLGYLNAKAPSEWDRMLYKVIKLQPGGWEIQYSKFVEFVKKLKYNWFKPIPDLLRELEKENIGIDDFFKLERKVTFKLSSLLSDINILQKEILPEKNYDISRFVSLTSHAFLPSTVYQLEEYGLPRMLSRKIHESKLINFYDKELDIHTCLDKFKMIGTGRVKNSIKMDVFDEYILDYFFEGISLNRKK